MALPWEEYRDVITYLYMHHTLAEVMRIMTNEHSFTANARTYYTYFKAWGVGKHVNGRGGLAEGDFNEETVLPRYEAASDSHEVYAIDTFASDMQQGAYHEDYAQNAQYEAAFDSHGGEVHAIDTTTSHIPQGVYHEGYVQNPSASAEQPLPDLGQSAHGFAESLPNTQQLLPPSNDMVSPSTSHERKKKKSSKTKKSATRDGSHRSA